MYTFEHLVTEIYIKRIISRISGLVFLLLSVAVYAEDNVSSNVSGNVKDNVTANIVEISPGIGYFNFNSESGLEDDIMGSLGLGLHFSRSWAMLLHYSAINSSIPVKASRSHVDAVKYHVDVLRFFNTEKPLRPYLVAGLGEIDMVYEGIKNKDTQLNGGLGLYYKLSPNWSVRTDVRIFANLSEHYNDNAITMTFGYRFIDGEQGF